MATNLATNLAINTELLEEAQRLANLGTKKDTVNLALKEFVFRRKQLEIVELFGTMDPDPDYDYKRFGGGDEGHRGHCGLVVGPQAPQPHEGCCGTKRQPACC